MGCAVACVAARCGISYRRALALFAKPENAWTRGYYCEEVVTALANVQLAYEFLKYDSVQHRGLLKKDGTIVFIEPSAKYPAGHYLLKTRRGWMNPWSNFPALLPLQSSFQRSLPGKVSYFIYEPKVTQVG